MKISKKLLGAAMSLALVGSQGMMVLASGTAPTTTGGNANILDYQVESVVVPTTLKIVLNPKGYDITTKYAKAATYAAGTVYYEKKADGSYAKMDPQPTSFSAGTDYYTAVTADDEVVSLNYGIANKSTGAKNVKVDFAATYTAEDGKKAITFVDSAAKAQAYDATNNDVGAKSGEHKMYLAIASASAAPTAETHKKTTDTSPAANKTYYTKGADGSFTKLASAPSADDMKTNTYYEDDTVIGVEITAAELSDVSMTKATAENKAFAKGTTHQADASIAYNLGAAAYALKDGETIDFTTTQVQLANKLELSTIGGVAGFTLTGEINEDADWSEADATAITITPTYTITNAAGTETALTGTHNQVNLGPSLATTSYTIDASNTPIIITVGNLGDETIASVINLDVNVNLMSGGFATVNGSNVTITSNYLAYFEAGISAQIKITTSSGTELICTIGRS